MRMRARISGVDKAGVNSDETAIVTICIDGGGAPHISNIERLAPVPRAAWWRKLRAALERGVSMPNV